MSKCTRCGKERIVKSSRVEKLEKSTVTYTVTICPDPKCQRMVEDGIEKEESRRKIFKDEHDRRIQEQALRRKTSISLGRK